MTQPPDGSTHPMIQALLRALVLPALLLVGAAAWAQEVPPEEESCTFNTKHYREQAKALAKSKKDSELDLASYTVTWPDARYGRVTVTIGGCYHLGLSVTSIRKAARPLRQAEATAMAQRLIREFLPKGCEDAAAALGRRSTRTEQWAGGRYYQVDGYESVVVDHKFEKGKSTVTVDLMPLA